MDAQILPAAKVLPDATKIKHFDGNNFGEITLYSPEVSTHFHFCLQSLKCDTLPPPPNFQIVAI
jgi:hypothetical protein